MSTPRTIEYVQPGGCMLADGGGAGACVLERSQCQLYLGGNLGSDFYSSHRIAQTLANSNDPSLLCLDYIHDVQVGRCSNPTDEEICATDASACVVPRDFIALDDWCRILDDTSPGSAIGQTQFGSCINFGNENYNDQHCFWASSDCDEMPQGEDINYVWFAPHASSLNQLCQCENVETGACFTSVVTTSADHFCAVSADGCDAGHVYKTVRQLEDDGHTFQCFLCPQTSRSSKPAASSPSQPSPSTPNLPSGTTPTIEYVKPGACMLDSIAGACALERSRCGLYLGGNLGSEFYSSLRLEDAFSNANNPSLGCIDYINQVQLGRCSNPADNEICAGDASTCVVPRDYIPLDDWCLVLDDTSPGTAIGKTQFGKCSNIADDTDVHCYWSMDDCGETTSHIWLAPSSVNSGDVCRCEQVETGACFTSTSSVSARHYCAVSESGCDNGHTFKTARQLISDGHGFQCFLCPPSVRPTKAAAPTSPSVPSPSAPSPSTYQVQGSNNNHDESLEAGIIVVIVLIVLGFLATMVWCIFRRCKKKKESDARDGMHRNSSDAVETEDSSIETANATAIPLDQAVPA